MVKDKFADSTIVKAIEANHTAFDVSATALIVLKDSGVSQTVIEAMLSAGIPKGANAAAQPAATVGKQAQASSPQSAQSAASAPPPPTQSQAQSTPPCSDVPILKRGIQPARPPCPDPAAGRVAPCGLRTHAFAESRRILDRKGQRGGVRVFREASQLYLRGVHVAVYPARPRGGNAPGRGFG